MIRLLPLVVAFATAFGWSDPVPIATTSAAVPPAVVAAAGRVHVFWLDRRSPTAPAGDLWHAILTPSGRLARSPSRIRTEVDVRLAYPAAVPWGGGVAAAWMTRTSHGVTMELAAMDGEGGLKVSLQTGAAPAEEAGRIALASSPDGVLHAVWSQFDTGQRRIWYARVTAAGRASSRPVAVAAGDAPALILDPDPVLFWWEPAGAGGFRLMTGSLKSGRLTSSRALTGTIALVYPVPVLPVRSGTETVLLIPTLERAFSTAGKLYAMRVGDSDGLAPGSGLPQRVPLLGQTRVSDVSVGQHGRRAVAVWSQPVGRRQNSELHAARVMWDGEVSLEPPSRLTYTIPGSLKPAAAVVGDALAAVWLEVAGFGEFSLSFSSSAAPRRHQFLLGITELDLYRPGALIAYALLAAASVLPIAFLLTATTLLPAALLVLIAQMIATPFRRLDESLRTPMIRLAAVLLATLAIQLMVRDLIPGRPAPALLAIPLAGAALPALTFLARREMGGLPRALIPAGIVFLAAVVALFPWGAGQLTQF